MKPATAILTLLLAASAFGQSESNPVKVEGSMVSITAKGDDVRGVLYDLFQQSGHNFVLDAGVRFVLYLHLDKVTFQEALEIIVKNAEIGYEVKNGVYYIGKGRKAKPTDVKAGESKPNPTPTPAAGNESKPTGMVNDAQLQKRLTTRYSITPINKVFEEFTRQTGVKIEVDKDVPEYKLDAFLIDTSLKYALDVICDAAKLKWSKTAHGTIRISKGSGTPQPETKTDH
jgi:hypothetical protein